MAKLPRPPGSAWQQLVAALLALGLVTVPVVKFQPPTWAGVLLLTALGGLVLYGIALELCPEVELPPNTPWVLGNPAGRTRRGIAVLEKTMVVEIARNGGNRRGCHLAFAHTVKNTGDERLRQIDFPMVADIPLYEGDIVVRATIGDSPEIVITPRLQGDYSWILELPMPHRGLPPGKTEHVRFSYEHEAFARIDDDTWFLDLRSFPPGGRALVELRFPAGIDEQATAYVVRQRGLCRRRTPLGSADMQLGERWRTLSVRYVKRRGDVLLVVDTRNASIG